MTTESVPTISVIIPCYNDGAYLRESVNSVLVQQGEFLLSEVVVVDDGSDDAATLDALSNLSDDPRVLTLPNEEPKGPGGARNTGVRHASGDWIVFLDADDVFCEDSIAARVRAAGQFPESRWIGADFVLWHEDGSLDEESFFTTRSRPRKWIERAIVSGQPMVLSRPVDEFIDGPPTNMCCTMVKKDLIDEVGGFDSSQRLQQDYHLFVRLAHRSDFVFVPQVVMHYRQHGGNSTQSSVNTLRWRETACRKLLADAAFAPYSKALKRKIAEICLQVSTAFSTARSHLPAFGAAIRGVRIQPGSAENWKRLLATMVLR